ncbi:MAG TPA: UDP-glucose/GDP-mannose dehydrogenase family protein [Piscinibacter sp.]|jgi:UDPglucose 6-dehydrogenase|uniref:UDP-glucose dehydrogenase family protein n=1 Tax=Piscinibacter sp. TaxID=1903157 RepID=UPI001B452658|nr:UDP-glucose/GDP-mannose dehydrogenase family protein [Piscinibacter sp.]MBK7533734.1 UDP-glucose/GDP-mannose dehydrogenase family protein [Piscinibacter sp.]MBP6541741.1 UDP-glucose/GDP-mannose dehydrogenase family protein [Piscinibacter sp.]HOY33801.1 UDP-glucose/GDP-mannose dehydrogenase family protein [Piscinibacter sp.]HPG77089.1 UDP-glucose/GDP-mannose dehydrogenase family protein [Piscinibacter sp.]HPM65037.1 UDP-glucose/GDP-mannose dehydrogenase family protein [Piscinibacter sp.]
MKLTVVGTGYVGLVTGACFAEMGNDVLCIDVDADKIARLEKGEIPIFEPGLREIVLRNVEQGRLHFSTDVREGVRFGTMQFIAVGTPPDEDGAADMQHVLAAARSIGEHMTDYKLVIDKSTVPVGTADAVRESIAQALAARGVDVPYSVVSNPEFLKEGAAVEDFMRPDRIVVGADDVRARYLMQALYAPFQRQRDKLILMDVRSAELTKYAANAMLATRISFMNEMALLAEKLGADIEQVRRGIGSDPRIGTQFLYAGCGYGGSCFPKDVKALVHSAANVGEPLHVLAAVERANERQKHVLVDRIVARYGDDLRGRHFALWGLAFKPDTDDLREAPSRVIVAELARRGARITAHDPEAMAAARKVFAELPALEFAPTPMQALEGVDALVIVTEWKAYRSPDFARMATLMRERVIVDGRNLFDPELVRDAGFDYTPIGRRAAAQAAEAPFALAA